MPVFTTYLLTTQGLFLLPTYQQPKACFYYLPTNNPIAGELLVGRKEKERKKKATKLTTVVNKGTGIQQKTDHLPTNPSSFMVCTGGCWFTLALLISLSSGSQSLSVCVSGVLLQRALAQLQSEAWHKSLLLFIATALWMMASNFSRRSIKWGYQNAVRFDLVVSKTCMTFQAVCFFSFADFHVVQSVCTL